MNLLSKFALASVGTVALAGSALAAERAIHVMKVNLPDGTVAHVRYFGDVPVRIQLVPVADAVPVALLDPRVGFAGFDEIFAHFDRQQAEIMQHVAAMQQQATAAPSNGKLDQAAVTTLPRGGTVSYSYTSYSSGANGKGGCAQSYQMTSYGNAQPKVVSQSSGDCSKAAKFDTAPVPVKTPAPQPKTVPHDAV